MNDFLKRLFLWAVRKGAYLAVSAGLVFLSETVAAASGNILSLELKGTIFGLGTVVTSELRRKFLPELLSVAVSGDVPTEY